MEAAKGNIKTTISEARLVALRATTKKVTFFFTFFLVFLFLSTAALFTYAILDLDSNSKPMAETTSLHSSKIINSDSEVNASLQTAVERLQNVTFFLKSIPGLKNCSDRVNRGLVQIQGAIAWPSDPTMRSKIGTVEGDLDKCMNDLGKMGLESREMREAKVKALEAWESVKKSWDLAAAAEDWKRRGEKKKWEWIGEMSDVQNVFLFVLGMMVISFIGFLLCCVCINTLCSSNPLFC